MAHLGLSTPRRIQAAFGGEADTLSNKPNRPVLTLNGHPGAVQRIPAQSPMQPLR